MLEEKLNYIIISVEQQMDLVKIKIKNNKKNFKQLENLKKDEKYLDMEKLQEDKEKLANEFSNLDMRLHKLKKVLYRLRVCEKILNNEEI